MPRYRLTADARGRTADYTMVLRRTVEAFMKQECKGYWHIAADRKHGTLEFDMPEAKYEPKLREALETLVFRKGKFVLEEIHARQAEEGAALRR